MTTSDTNATAEPKPWTNKTQSAPVSIPVSIPAPIPVLAPYLGLVASVLCTFGGAWLLLAPYALDFRHGAAHLPRTAVVDLGSGAAIVVAGIATALLFSTNLVKRLRADSSATPESRPAKSAGAAAERQSESESEPESELEPEPAPGSEPAPEPAPSASTQETDPGGALRELLTPLVAALAADLRSHDEERRRQEP